MPNARPLPRKFLSQIEDSQSILKQIAAKSRIAIERIESDRQSVDQLGTLLLEIEAKSYQVALDLAEIDVAESCEECPAAPPMTKVKAHLIVLADQLSTHALEAKTLLHSTDSQDEKAGNKR